MTVRVNGESREVPAGTTLGALVDELVSARRGVAVALDGEVLARSTWDEVELHDDARVEVVGAVQGG